MVTQWSEEDVVNLRAAKTVRSAMASLPLKTPLAIYLKRRRLGLPPYKRKRYGEPVVVKDFQPRFWAKVKKTKKCWVWIGANVKGYGVIKIGGRNRRAHRVSFEIAVGVSIPKGILICHRCDNPPCVRPDHLFPGKQWTNMLDAKLKGRLYRASK